MFRFAEITSPISDDDGKDITHLRLFIGELDRYVNHFRAALFLFNASFTASDQDDRNLFIAWKFMSARDGTISIYNFIEAVRFIKVIARTIPPINKITNWNLLRETTRRIKADFPSFEKLRHGVAHATELMGTRKNFLRSATRHDYQGEGIASIRSRAFISEYLNENTFSCTHEGHVRKFDMTIDTLRKLESIRNQVVMAFQQAPRHEP